MSAARGAVVLVRLATLGAVYGVSLRIADAAARASLWAHRAMQRLDAQRRSTEAGRAGR